MTPIGFIKAAASCCTLLMLAFTLGAQAPTIADVPFYLGPTDRYLELVQRRAWLIQRRSAVMAGVEKQNAQCSQVPHGTPQAAKCQQSQAAIQNEISAYAALVNRFNNDVGQAASAWDAQHSQIGPRTGAAGAVRGEVFAVRPDGSSVAIVSGTPLFLNERVITKPGARLQVMLLDESVFTLGPDSDMVLDEFVYDPSLNISKIAARITKGVFRFVTGKVARRDPHNMQIRVPTGDLGIRGTDVEVNVAPDSSSTVKLYSGEAEWTRHETGSVLVLRAGQMISIDAEGVVGRPGPITH